MDVFLVVVVHGGAGIIPKERSEKSTAGVRAATRAGYSILRGGGSSMDAVVEAVTQLENNPAFNAGCGAVLAVKGDVQMDALVMDGKTLASGAMSNVRKIANCVQLARPVMDKMGTVGAVAVDSEANVACATSTGGILNKLEGRVGDVPCIGSGGYADNQVGAVSTTGHGEAIMKVTLARLILFHMEQGQSVEAASDSALAYMKSRVGGLGGVVTVDPQGRWAARFSSLQMSWAAAQKDTLHYGLYAGEHFTQSIDDPL